MTAVGSQRADTYNIHARWCSGGCSRWLATGAPSCLPYPCRCADTKAAAPDWIRDRDRDNVTCWWKTKAGSLRSRCPCWGSVRDDKPGDCCAWHLASPRYLDDRAGAFLALLDPDRQAEELAAPPEPQVEPQPVTEPAVGEEGYIEDGEPWGRDPARERKPYIRRWPAETLLCPCLPDRIPKGIHCPQCCVTFGNQMAADMHRPLWTRPCRAPEDLRDVDTGAPLLRPDSAGAWRMVWPSDL